MGMKRPDNFQLYTDSNGNAELRVAFRRENIPYLSKVLKVVDRMMATDERFEEAARAKQVAEAAPIAEAQPPLPTLVEDDEGR